MQYPLSKEGKKIEINEDSIRILNKESVVEKEFDIKDIKSLKPLIGTVGGFSIKVGENYEHIYLDREEDNSSFFDNVAQAASLTKSHKKYGFFNSIPILFYIFWIILMVNLVIMLITTLSNDQYVKRSRRFFSDLSDKIAFGIGRENIMVTILAFILLLIIAGFYYKNKNKNKKFTVAHKR